MRMALGDYRRRIAGSMVAPFVVDWATFRHPPTIGRHGRPLAMVVIHDGANASRPLCGIAAGIGDCLPVIVFHDTSTVFR